MRTYKKKDGSRAYRSYSETGLSAALQCCRKGTMSLLKASKTFKIPYGTLHNRTKGDGGESWKVGAKKVTPKVQYLRHIFLGYC